MSQEIFPKGTPVLIDHHRDNRFAKGVVFAFHEESSMYEIEITGGIDVIGNPARVGRIVNVFPSNLVKE